VKLQTPEGKRWVEGAVFEPSSPRLVMLDGVAVEASLEGTMIVTANTDQPGVIGAIGTVLACALPSDATKENAAAVR
jgi:D-3-phosphoglycerate dehydrogenase